MRKKLQDNFISVPIARDNGMPGIRVTCRTCADFEDITSAASAKAWMSSHKKTHKEKPQKKKKTQEETLERLLEEYCAAAKKAFKTKDLRDRHKLRELGIGVFLHTSPKSKSQVGR